MANVKNVTVIPATLTMHTHKPTNSRIKRKVAGYARVSTDSDEQATSYEAQIDYYTQYIQQNDEWQFVKVYTDEGISGTNTKHRAGFNEMIEDALAGKIDLIITKSVSRFARNTVDSLTTVRKLKEKGVEVFFQKENIYTLDSKGELLITIMSSLAQEESRSISENVTWGQRKRFADGKVMMPYKRFLGYCKGEDGTPQIVEEEAQIVRNIYDMFLQGKTGRVIAKQLTDDGVPTPGGQPKWYENTVLSILTNEKYKGSALLQKKFTTDFLTKKQKINEGEVPQYYVEDSHPAIIDPQIWELVQIEMARRKQIGGHYSGNSVFSTRIVCGECGTFYGARFWSNKGEVRRVVWRCGNKYGANKGCTSPIVAEDDLKLQFVFAVNEIIDCRDEVIENCYSLLESYENTSQLDRELADSMRECEIVAELNRRLVEENARRPMDQEQFNMKYESYVAKYETESDRIEQIKKQKEERRSHIEQLRAFITELESREDLIEEFNERMWLALIDVVVIQHDGTKVFKFKNGMEVRR